MSPGRALAALVALAASTPAGFLAGGTEAGGTEGTPAPPPAAAPALGVGLRVLRFVDGTRFIRVGGGSRQPRRLITYVRYPAAAPGRIDLANAPPARGRGPFPLVVFAHGFAVTPAIYARLLRSWTQAGYVVAAPVFPLGNAHAPGGPDEADLVNQPQDIRFAISSLLAAADPTGPLAGLIDPTRIAVAGQSDGGVTALAATYSRRFRDRRIRAAMILSGAEMSGVGGYSFSPGAPALLATQGTADRVNEPRFTDAFFESAGRPKYLLRLLGAGHLPPYTGEQPQLAIVERVTTAFLNGYLDRSPGVARTVARLGNVPGRAAMTAFP